jgi:hypothetical protein
MKRMLGLAVLLTFAFGTLHILGFRQDAAILSGSSVPSIVGGIAYVLSYFTVLIVVPVLLLGALFLAVLARVLPTSE